MGKDRICEFDQQTRRVGGQTVSDPTSAKGYEGILFRCWDDVRYLKAGIKLQEAVLSAIGSLAQDNPSVASKLSKSSSEQPGAYSEYALSTMLSSATAVLSTVLMLSKSRSSNMQLAASVW